MRRESLLALSAAFVVTLCAAPAVRAQTDANGFFTEYLVAAGYNNPNGCGNLTSDLAGADYLCDGSVSESTIVPEIGLELGFPVDDPLDCDGDAPPALQGGFHVNAPINQNGNLAITTLLATAEQYINFGELLAEADFVMGYAWVWIENSSAQPRRVVLELASDDAVTVELNRNEVWSNVVCRGAGAAGTIQDRVPITLAPGGNLLQFKVFEEGGGHHLRARLTNELCEPIFDGVDGIFIGLDPIEIPDVPILTRTITTVAGGADIAIAVDATGSYTLEERFDSDWQLSNVNPPATATGSTFVRWENVTATSLSYSLRRQGDFGQNEAIISGRVTIPSGEAVVEGDREIPGGLPAYVPEVLVSAAITLPAGQTGCTVTVDMINGAWITNGDDITDRTIVPEEGLVIDMDFGASQGTQLTDIAAQAEYWAVPGDALGGMVLVRETSGDGFYDWQRGDIYTAAPDPDNTMNVAFFYAINPTDEPMIVIMGFGSDDSGGVRVNGHPAHAIMACRGFPGYTDKFHVRLDPGKNLISAYTFDAAGGFTMGLRFEDENFQPKAVRTTLDPTGYDPEAHGPQTGLPPIVVMPESYVTSGVSAGFITEWLVPAQVFETGQAGNTLAGALPEDYISQDGGPLDIETVFAGAIVEPGVSGLISTAVRGSSCGFTTLVRYSGFEQGNPSDPGDFDGEIFYGAPDNYSTSMVTVVTNHTNDDLQAFFAFTSDDAGTLFVNNVNVVEFLTPRGRAGANTVDTLAPNPVLLEPGPNLVQMSYNEAAGGSGARVRMLNACGQPFTPDQVTVSVTSASEPTVTATRTVAGADCSGNATVTITFTGSGAINLREELPAGTTGSNPSRGAFNAQGTILTLSGNVANGETITYNVAGVDGGESFCSSVVSGAPIVGDLNLRLNTDVCIEEEELTEVGYFVNSGGLDFIDSLGRLWREDSSANPTRHLVSPNAATADWGLLTPIDTTSDELSADREYPPQVYATERWMDGDVVYRFTNLPRGCYEVVLLFMEGCCSESCADIADPQQSPGACRVFDVHLNGEIVLDQYSQNVHASHVSGRLPGVDSNLIGVTNLFYAADVTEIEVIIDDLGAGNPPENASIKGIAIRKLTDDEAAQVGAPCGGATGPIFLRGDADASGALNLTDAIRILTFLFVGNVEVSCLDAADSDDSGALNLTDGIFVLNYLFVGLSPAPPPPFPECGPDPTDDSTACEVSQPNCSQ